MDAAVGDEPQMQVPLGAGQADIGEAALFLEPGAAALVERALVREQAFLPAGQEHRLELQPLGRMQRHDGDRVELLVLLGVHDQRDMLEEASAATRTPPSSGSAPSGFPAGPALRPSGRSATSRCSRISSRIISASSVCGLVSSMLCQRREIGGDLAQRRARLRLQLVGLGELAGRLQHRHAARARGVVDLADRRIRRGRASAR